MKKFTKKRLWILFACVVLLAACAQPAQEAPEVQQTQAVQDSQEAQEAQEAQEVQEVQDYEAPDDYGQDEENDSPIVTRIEARVEENAQIQYIVIQGLDDLDIQQMLNEEIYTFFSWIMMDAENQDRELTVTASGHLVGGRYFSAVAFDLIYEEGAAYPTHNMRTAVFNLETGEPDGVIFDFIEMGDELIEAIRSGVFFQARGDEFDVITGDMFADVFGDPDFYENYSDRGFYLTQDTLGLYVTGVPHMLGSFWMFEAEYSDILPFLTEKLTSLF